MEITPAPKPSIAIPELESKKPALFAYANCTFPKEDKSGTFEETVAHLKEMAMPEKWDYRNKFSDKLYPILNNYLLHTFARIQEEGKIAVNGRYSAFNTGLATKNQEDIFMLFRKSNNGFWFFSEFCKESDRKMGMFSPLPERANYFDNEVELLYNHKYELRLNINHIVDDPANFERFPDAIKQLSKHQLIITFQGAVEHAKKRVKRNYLTAVPQFYRGEYMSEGQLQLLLPLCLIDPAKADLALAIYKEGESYNGRTCLTLDMAINNARLINKPDDDWLTP